jgi:hypothetical protein
VSAANPIPDRDALQHEALAEFLFSIGWASPNDAQWTTLRDSLGKIAELARQAPVLAEGWLPLDSMSTPPTGKYILGHRGHQVITHYFNPHDEWALNTRLGWQVDPATIGATHYMPMPEIAVNGQPTELEMHRADYQDCKAAGFESPGELLAAHKLLSGKFEALIGDYKRLQTEYERVRQVPRLHRDMERGDFWAWQGDGEDHPESLVCPVLVPAAQVREWLAMKQDAGTYRYIQDNAPAEGVILKFYKGSGRIGPSSSITWGVPFPEAKGIDLVDTLKRIEQSVQSVLKRCGEA